MGDVKLCKDCRWERWSLEDRLWLHGKRDQYAECARPGSLTNQYAECARPGSLTNQYAECARPGSLTKFCSVERDHKYTLLKLCGASGSGWEPKPRRWWQFWKAPK